jgi:hypothetical protein
MNDYEGPERRARCNDCVKDDVGTLVDSVAELGVKVSKIIGASGWQKTIIVLLLAGGLGGSLVSSYVVIAKAHTDGEQNTNIALISEKVETTTKILDKAVNAIDKLAQQQHTTQDQVDDLIESQKELTEELKKNND